VSTPRIEQAEILSSRLVVPLKALDQLREACPLPLALSRDERGLTLTHERCALSFRRDGDQALLSEVRIQADPRGAFFREVLCALMSAHGGDLHAKLAWRVPNREDTLGSAEVRIRRGRAETTLTPTLRGTVNNLRAAAVPLFPEGHAAQLADAAALEAEEATPSESDAKVSELLDQARKHYAEYLRLRRERTRS
jgi:hypothetical protein